MLPRLTVAKSNELNKENKKKSSSGSQSTSFLTSSMALILDNGHKQRFTVSDKKATPSNFYPSSNTSLNNPIPSLDLSGLNLAGQSELDTSSDDSSSDEVSPKNLSEQKMDRHQTPPPPAAPRLCPANPQPMGLIPLLSMTEIGGSDIPSLPSLSGNQAPSLNSNMLSRPHFFSTSVKNNKPNKKAKENGRSLATFRKQVEAPFSHLGTPLASVREEQTLLQMITPRPATATTNKEARNSLVRPSTAATPIQRNPNAKPSSPRI